MQFSFDSIRIRWPKLNWAELITDLTNLDLCSAGDYMTENGCQQCGENTYSGDGASACISCPDDMISAAGSTSEADCEYGRFGQRINFIPIIQSLTLEWLKWPNS